MIDALRSSKLAATEQNVSIKSQLPLPSDTQENESKVQSLTHSLFSSQTLLKLEAYVRSSEAMSQYTPQERTLCLEFLEKGFSVLSFVNSDFLASFLSNISMVPGLLATEELAQVHQLLIEFPTTSHMISSASKSVRQDIELGMTDTVVRYRSAQRFIAPEDKQVVSMISNLLETGVLNSSMSEYVLAKNIASFVHESIKYKLDEPGHDKFQSVSETLS